MNRSVTQEDTPPHRAREVYFLVRGAQGVLGQDVSCFCGGGERDKTSVQSRSGSVSLQWGLWSVLGAPDPRRTRPPAVPPGGSQDFSCQTSLGDP